MRRHQPLHAVSTECVLEHRKRCWQIADTGGMSGATWDTDADDDVAAIAMLLASTYVLEMMVMGVAEIEKRGATVKLLIHSTQTSHGTLAWLGLVCPLLDLRPNACESLSAPDSSSDKTQRLRSVGTSAGRPFVTVLSARIPRGLVSQSPPLKTSKHYIQFGPVLCGQSEGLLHRPAGMQINWPQQQI